VGRGSPSPGRGTTSLEIREGETCDEFIDRIVAASGKPTDEEAEAIWAMLPPVLCLRNPHPQSAQVRHPLGKGGVR
jgi:hypothetical protein